MTLTLRHYFHRNKSIIALIKLISVFLHKIQICRRIKKVGKLEYGFKRNIIIFWNKITIRRLHYSLSNNRRIVIFAITPFLSSNVANVTEPRILIEFQINLNASIWIFSYILTRISEIRVDVRIIVSTILLPRYQKIVLLERRYRDRSGVNFTRFREIWFIPIGDSYPPCGRATICHCTDKGRKGNRRPSPPSCVHACGLCKIHRSPPPPPPVIRVERVATGRHRGIA